MRNMTLRATIAAVTLTTFAAAQNWGASTARVYLLHEVGQVGTLDLYVNGKLAEANIQPGFTQSIGTLVHIGNNEFVMVKAGQDMKSGRIYSENVDVKGPGSWKLVFLNDLTSSDQGNDYPNPEGTYDVTLTQMIE